MSRWLFSSGSLLNTFTRQICFRKVKGNAFDDIDDSENDENAVSINDLLARAANDPNSDTDHDSGSGGSDERGSPLSADNVIAPANTIHRNALHSVFHDVAQVARDRHVTDQGRRIDQPLPVPHTTPLTTSTTSSLNITEPTRRPETLAQSSEHVDRRTGSTQPTVSTLAGVNSNGKRPRRESQDDSHEQEPPLPPIAVVPTKRARGSGVPGRGRGGRGRSWFVKLLSFYKKELILG